MLKIDAHHHLWEYSPEAYPWIGPDARSLQRTFTVADLEAVARPVGVTGAVAVQARETLDETRWLLKQARASPFVRGVVGWADLASPDISAHLAGLAGDPLLRGIRMILQDDGGGERMGRADFNAGVAALRPHKLTYDLLITQKHLPEAIALADRHPQQIFVLDHVAKPRIKDGVKQPWAGHIRDLARRPNVFCKVSGMTTEADHTKWHEADLRPYWETVLEAFTPSRLMFGSDWPVCLLASDYARWHEVVAGWVAPLTPTEQTALWGQTAVRAYGLRV